MRRTFAALLALPLAALIIATTASPAAAVTTEQKLSVLSSWTQTSASSYNAWLSGRNNQGAWSAYAFDWSTDYCSSSPDNPLGFDFKLSCARHDFGYRNHKAMGIFPANKDRLDSALYEDLKRKCATYNVVVRPACTSLAWTYYQAVKSFGTIAVSKDQIDQAANYKARLLAAEARRQDRVAF